MTFLGRLILAAAILMCVAPQASAAASEARARAGLSRAVAFVAVGRFTGKAMRVVNRARHLPRHTKLVLVLVGLGIVVFFVGTWAKSRL